jgi:hypothetical protein
MQGWHTVTDAYRALFAAVIERAIEDLKGTGPRCGKKETDRAMAFILSEDCEAYCLELRVDYEVVREKAAALYRRAIGKETLEPARKKRQGRPPKALKGIRTRQSPGKLNNSTYR